MSYELTAINAEQMRIAAAGVIPLPIEQSAVWDEFDKALGRENAGRYLFQVNGKPAALISLAHYQMRGVPFLWAKRGPVWLRSQTPDNEIAFRQLLAQEIKREFPKVPFIRLHARYQHPQLHELLQYLTYDETVEIDTVGGKSEAVLAAMHKDGRRGVRRAIKRMSDKGAEAKELTGLSWQEFQEVYAVMIETARRDGFRAHPIETYWKMLQSLGPEHARLFGVEYAGAIVAWVLALIHDQKAYAYYGAHSAAAREVLASEYLDFWVAQKLGEEGVLTYDLMGVDSPRCPDYYQLGVYKRRFASHSKQVDGAWDYALRPLAYQALTAAVKGKRVGAKLVAKVRRR